MKKLILIHNPGAGVYNKSALKQLLSNQLSPYFEYTYEVSQNYTDFINKIDLAILQKPSIIAICGGDGSISSAAKKIINTQILLGIIPSGSGNGFANSLGITNIKLACIALIKCKHITVDTLSINEKICINVSGVGFDAHVSSLFAKETKRGFFKYLKIVLREFRQKDYKVSIQAEGQKIEKNVLFLSIANSNQWGNQIKINPNANMQDGKFEIIALEQISFWEIFKFIYYLLTNKAHTYPKVTFISTKNAIIEVVDAPLHIDGEYMGNINKLLTVKMFEKKLNVIV